MVYLFCRESDIIICSCELDDNCVEIHFLLKMKDVCIQYFYLV